MVRSKYHSFEKGGKLFFLLAVAAAMIAPADAAMKAKWRSSTQSSPWQAEVNLSFSPYSTGGSEILLDTTAAGRLQTIDGFGGSPNEVGMIALHSLPAKVQDSLVRALYDTVWGCKMAVIRLPIGCSDFSNGTYTYDDLPANTTDYTMDKVSIDRDKPGTIAFCKAAQNQNPNIKIWGSPWTAPPWLKTNNNWISPGGGDCSVKQTTEALTAYALYFSKVVTLLQAELKNYFALSFQNEPRVCQPFPSTLWSGGATMANFMKNYLYPKMHADHPDVELWTPTMNVGDQSYFKPMLDDASTTKLAAACFQYEGRPVIPWVHSTYPNIRLYYTEMVCGGGDNQWSFAFDPSFKDLKYYIDNGANGADWWNLILEKNGNSGPTVNFRQNSMITMDTVAKTIKFTPIYYVMKHFSFYIRPGAKVVKTSGSYASNQVSAMNTDGSFAVVAQNNGGGAQTVKIKFGNQMVSANMPASSFGSFLIWDDAVVASQPGLAGKSQPRIASVNRFYKVAGDKFSFPGEFEGKTCTGAIYDVNGRFVKAFSVKSGTVSLTKDFGVSKGVYVVHVKNVRI